MIRKTNQLAENKNLKTTENGTKSSAEFEATFFQVEVAINVIEKDRNCRGFLWISSVEVNKQLNVSLTHF